MVTNRTNRRQTPSAAFGIGLGLLLTMQTGVLLVDGVAQHLLPEVRAITKRRSGGIAKLSGARMPKRISTPTGVITIDDVAAVVDGFEKTVSISRLA